MEGSSGERGFGDLKEKFPIIQEIWKRCPNFDSGFVLQSKFMKMVFMNALAKVYVKLTRDVDTCSWEELKDLELAAIDFHNLGLDVSWLQMLLLDARLKVYEKQMKEDSERARRLDAELKILREKLVKASM